MGEYVTQDRIGRRRERITIQTATTTSDAMGGQAVTWSTLMTVWAAVQPLSGTDKLDALQADADLSHRIYMRYSSQVTEKQRVSWRGRTFEIAAAMDQESRRRLLVLDVAERR